MPFLGGAKKQTEIRFNLSQHESNKLPSNRDQSGTDNQPNLLPKSKRPRSELEDNNTANELQLPETPGVTPIGSATSLDFTASRETIIDPDDMGPREDRSSTKTNADEDAERIRIVRLERLRDKSDRYSSHIGFLKECLQAKIIPKGLRIDLEPLIGNTDEGFCTKWFAKLEEFSFSLMNDIIEHSEKIENETEEKIRRDTEDLKTIMDADDLKELAVTMDNLAIQRRKRQSLTKRKKFHYLRYNRPERRSTVDSRDNRDNRPER